MLICRAAPLGGMCTRFVGCATQVPSCGLKNYVLPPSYEGVEFPDRNKLKFMDKVPTYPAGLRPPKMMKNLIFMRGPEPVHHSLIHQQYGIVALGPGRLRSGHFEMMRMTIGRRLDTSRMFAIWRVDPPWQPVTRKGQGKRMGGGKGAIDHYVTPVKHGRIIVELGGNCEFKEAFPILREVAEKLPFKAKPVSHQMLQEMRQKESNSEKYNINPYTLEYIIRNNLGKSHHWISPYDRKWFGKHI
ncbi:39S ribosomal protein L16, mitochondrial [Folsomia candida]|uniref:39S ribosomal protein L16, mitochondrial n=1 Tax=Folsomia candida TaxID=158441 RepID=UPI000B90482C|nr:39S ribosomal protein L16, mitochondrial [Folsomia candida]